MGMITRVRGRLHSITKIDPVEKDEKIAETVCLLSVLFLLPYCGRGHAPLLLGLGGMWLATYSFLVLPVLISANYKYPVRWLRRLIQEIPKLAQHISGPMLEILRRIYKPIDKCDQVLLKMSNLTNMATQLLFFEMCNRVFCRNENGHYKVSALISLLFYFVITYFVNKIADLFLHFKKSNTPQVSRFRSATLCILKIIFEWAKAVIVVLSLREQGLKLEPNVLYTVTTIIYYLATESVYLDMFPYILSCFKIQVMEGMEEFYTHVLCDILVITMSYIMASILFFINFTLATVCIYYTFFLRVKMFYTKYWNKIMEEKYILQNFRLATKEELDTWNDICAICLNEMKRARITICGHLFHGQCLRTCIQLSNKCPLCKTDMFDEELFLSPDNS